MEHGRVKELGGHSGESSLPRRVRGWPSRQGTEAQVVQRRLASLELHSTGDIRVALISEDHCYQPLHYSRLCTKMVTQGKSRALFIFLKFILTNKIYMYEDTFVHYTLVVEKLKSKAIEKERQEDYSLIN